MKIGQKLALAFTLILFASTSFANGNWQYEVTITNLTKGQAFTPQLVATHSKHVSLFELGEPVSEPVEIVAEDGNTGPLTEALNALGNKVKDVTTIPGLLMPGQTISVTVDASRRHRFVSAIAMLIPTNDTFFAVNALRLPNWGEVVVESVAYDAGSELNDQKCANIPGPPCFGGGHSEGDNPGDEGYVYVSNGIHDLGTVDADGGRIIDPLTYDWRNPVALIKVRRVK